VLQEQGRWRDSLDRLAALSDRSDPETRHQALIYEVFAGINLGSSSTREMHEKLPQVMAVIRKTRHARILARAARTAAFLVSGSDDSDAARAVLSLLDSIPITDLDADSSGHLALGRARLLHEAGAKPESLREVIAAIESLQAHGMANLVMVQLHAGVGALKADKGCYQDAAASQEKALMMASRLGNDTLITSIAGNLALCYSRLGRYADQLQLVGRIPPPGGSEFWGFVEMLFAYSTALSLISLGRHGRAQEVITALDKRIIEVIPDWMVQAWMLWKADLLLLMPKRSEAMNVGRAAIERFSGNLLSPSFAGPYARWIALTQTSTRAQQIVEALNVTIEDFDAIDQAQILMALRMLRPDEGGMPSELDDNLKQKLDRLPISVQSQLATLMGEFKKV
jgi:tetratricopeptide (TPR) repeat protein